MKKLILLLACIAAMCTTLSAQISGTIGDLTWTLDRSGLLTISGVGEMPDNYVEGIALPNPWHESYLDIKSVIIEEGVTSIGYAAFYGCSNLASISIPNGVKKIGLYAFELCKNLTSITIPSSVISIEHAFYGCDNLLNFIVEEGNEQYSSDAGILYDKDKTALLKCPPKKSGDIVIPNSVKRIGESAFSRCFDLTSISIPSSVTSIEPWAFNQCYGLTSISIPENITSIENGLFYLCKKLASISIPSNVTNIGNGAFYGCESLTSVEIPDEVTDIGDNAFFGCTSLTSVEIPNKVTRIGVYAFNRCTNLASISIPSGTTNIGAGAFVYCSNLTSISLPEDITTIEEHTFLGCNKLTSIVIPNGVTSIGQSAFKGCGKLINFHSQASIPPTLGTDVFQYCITLYVPIGSKEAYEAAEGWQVFMNIKEFDFSSIEEINTVKPVVYPDFSAGGFYVKGINNEQAYIISDVNGKILSQGQAMDGEFISTTDFSTGIYIVQIGNYTTKLLVK